MTDPDSPAARSGRPAPSAETSADPGGSAPSAGTALRDSWWWSPTLALVLGLVVAGYQLESLLGPDPLWISWVVAGIGAVVALVGLLRLVKAYRTR